VSGIFLLVGRRTILFWLLCGSCIDKGRLGHVHGPRGRHVGGTVSPSAVALAYVGALDSI
jgi:hypothetical protein